MSLLTRLVVSVLMLTVVLSLPETASAQTAPSTQMDHAACYRSIIDGNDLFCLARYELPDSISDGVSDAWCAELVNQDGCDGTPADPTEPTSIPNNTVFLTLYDGCVLGDCASGTILNISRIPRINYGLAGSYLVAGHSVTWGDSDIHLCVESSDDPLVFGTPSIDCIPVVWNTNANDTAVQRDNLGADMVDQVRAVGILEAQPTIAYVANNRINSDGKVFAIEALSNADRILGSYFTEGTSFVTIPGTTPVAGSTVQANINSSTSAVQTAKNNFGASLGISGDGVGVLISIIIIFSLFIILLRFGVNLVFALIGSVSAAPVLVVYGILPFQIAAVLIVVLALPAAVKLVRTVTQQ